MPSELQQLRVLVTDAENEELKKQAAEKRETVSNFVRGRLGLKPLERGKYDRKKKD